MCLNDLIQLVQLVLVIFFILSITCFIASSIRKYAYCIAKTSFKANLRTQMKYSWGLSSCNYEAFHKFEIWRYYRYS